MQGRALHRVEEARRNRYFMNTDASLTVAIGGRAGHLPLQYRYGLDTVLQPREPQARRILLPCSSRVDGYGSYRRQCPSCSSSCGL